MNQRQTDLTSASSSQIHGSPHSNFHAGLPLSSNSFSPKRDRQRRTDSVCAGGAGGAGGAAALRLPSHRFVAGRKTGSKLFLLVQQPQQQQRRRRRFLLRVRRTAGAAHADGGTAPSCPAALRRRGFHQERKGGGTHAGTRTRAETRMKSCFQNRSRCAQMEPETRAGPRN